MLSIVVGPILFGFVFGLILGTRIHRKEEGSFKFTTSAIIVLIIGALLMSLDLGQFPFYTDVPIATAFISAIFGILIGSLLFGSSAKGDS